MAQRAWRVCYNLHSNDWNDEPEYIAVPYDIVGESKSGNAFLVERTDWYGKKHQHYIPKAYFYWSKEEADAVAYRKMWGLG